MHKHSFSLTLSNDSYFFLFQKFILWYDRYGDSMDVKMRMISHEKSLCKYATKSKEAVRLESEKMKDDIRPPFFHDIDRIIYSLAYTRYIDKTQVFSLKDNDHICKRMIHVQFVSKIAKTIGRALGLNEDLIEAIALGHDLGHVPFGHVGEAILNDLSLEYDHTYFHHNVQSVRQLMVLENHGVGSNITVQVLDGILCHNGEFLEGQYCPKKKSVDVFLREYEETYTNEDIVEHLVPSTLEGCVVRFSDMIAYLGRDIDDAVMLGLMKREDIPNTVTSVLGNNNRDIINTIVMDIIKNSQGKNYIKLSPSIYKAMKELKQFNYREIYAKANSKEQIEIYKKMFKVVFESCLKAVETKNHTHDIYAYFLNDMDLTYHSTTGDVRMVIDYIAGMTDDFLVEQYRRYAKL